MTTFNIIRAEIRSFEMTDAYLEVICSRYVVVDLPQGQVMEFQFFKLQSPGAVVIRGRGRVRMKSLDPPAMIKITGIEAVLFEWKQKVEPGELGFSLTA